MVETTKADQIRQLSKKWLETGDNTILDELTYALHDGVHFHVPNWRILERYKELSLELHAHFFWLGDVRGVKNDTCGVSQYARRCDAGDGSSARVEEPNILVTCTNGSERKCSVFIDVHELIQNPEGMQIGALQPGLVRLQTLDECLRANGYASESVARALALETVSGFTDRELVFLDRRLLVGENQLPDHVVEGRSKVMQTLPNDNAERKIRSGETESKIEAAIHVRISLGENAAFFQTSFDVSPYRCQVFLSPDEFLPNTVERMIHGKSKS